MKVYVHPIEASENIEAESKAFKAVSHLIHNMFRHLGSTLQTIESWGRYTPRDRDKAVGDDEDTEDESSQAESTPMNKRHAMIEMLPGDADDWNNSQLYRMLVKNVDETDDTLIFNFYWKANGADNSDNIEKLGVRLNKQGPDESDESYDSRLEEMLYTVATQLVSKATGGEVDSIADMRGVPEAS